MARSSGVAGVENVVVGEITWHLALNMVSSEISVYNEFRNGHYSSKEMKAFFNIKWLAI